MRRHSTGHGKQIGGCQEGHRGPQERDQGARRLETIGDKEKRIYELKKKNQELEKFKFVLDYKIKELRKQIEPKELEIAGMKETVTEMDAELDRYNKINQALELDNVSMQSKLEATQKHALRQRQEHVESVNLNNRFQGDLEETVQYIQDYKMLKASVKLLYQRHCGQVNASEAWFNWLLAY